MSILFDAGKPVKPARPFGAGILPADDLTTSSQVEPTPADDGSVSAPARQEARDFDMMAAESAALDALTLGLIPIDVAEWIAQTRGGHPA